MSFDLPYEFDTFREVRLVIKGALSLLALLALLALMALSATFLLVVRHEVLGAAGCVLIAGLAGAFAAVVRGHLPGARGQLTRDFVHARADRVWGVALRGPVGRFPMQDYRAVRAERVWGATDSATMSHRFERVSLIGKPGTPDVHVLRAPCTQGRSAAEDLAAALHLPLEVLHPAH